MTRMEARNVLMTLVVVGFFAVFVLLLRGPSEVAVVENPTHGAIGEPERRSNPFGAAPGFLVKTPDGVGLLQRERFAPLVQALLLAGSPTTVQWFIVPINIGPAIQSLTGWTFPHVSKEVGELIPALANRDATPAVVAEVIAPRILAPLEHRIPRLVRWCAISAVPRAHAGRELALQASARADEAASQPRGGSDVATTAITGAPPTARAVLVAFACPGDCRQAAKPVTRDVHWVSWHAVNFNASHGGSLWS